MKKEKLKRILVGFLVVVMVLGSVIPVIIGVL
jgi:hypothetical protein